MPATHKRLDLSVDVASLRAALLEKSGLFGVYPYRKMAPGSPHAEMDDIWVRYNDINPFLAAGSMEGFGDEHDSVWYPVYYELPEVKDIIFDVMSAVRGERLGGVLITRLPPGGKIEPHRDGGWHAEYYDKYYVPIQNDVGAIFGFEDGVIDPEEGEVYWFNNSELHWVENNTNDDRIAMIICIKTNHRSN